MSPVDQTPRIVGYKSIAVPPLVVLVSYHRDDQLASWYQHLYTFGPGALLVISVILLGTGLLMWQTGNLAYKNRILEVTLENMAHGLCMFDGQQRLIVCNERYAKMYGLSPGEMRPGTKLRSILEARVAAGSSPAAAQEYIDTRLAEVDPQRAVLRRERVARRARDFQLPTSRSRAAAGSRSTRTSPTAGATRRRSRSWRGTTC